MIPAPGTVWAASMDLRERLNVGAVLLMLIEQLRDERGDPHIGVFAETGIVAVELADLERLEG